MRQSYEAQTAILAPNTWQMTYLDGQKTARYMCPNGHSGLLDDHTIGPDGHVEPSVVCPYQEDCDFHDYVTLIGWRE